MKLYKELKVSFFVLLSTSLLILACDSKSPVETNDEIGTVISLVSECGGFDSASKIALGNIPFLHDAEKYCDAERLHWLYDENTKTLKVMNSRILLNCCGDLFLYHSWTGDGSMTTRILHAIGDNINCTINIIVFCYQSFCKS